MFTNRPAMKFCLPFIIGLVLGWHYAFPIWHILLAVVMLSIVTALAILSTSRRTFAPLLMSILVILFGILKVTYDGTYVSDESITHQISPGKTIELQGIIVDLPRGNARSFKFVIDVRILREGKEGLPVSGEVLVSVLKKSIQGSIIDSLTYGREVTLQGELTSVSTARNPGEFDLKQYLHLNNIDARLYIDVLDSSNLRNEASGNILAGLVYPVRRSIAERLDELIGGDEARFLKGLIIGERSEISLEVKTAFINSGVMHILAVSGLHVAIVVLILLALLQTMRVSENIRIIITGVLLVYYIFLTGGAPSVTRSVIMAIVFLGARLIERKSDVYNTLAFSAIVILLIDAKQLFQPGFQLSFVAVFSLIYLYPKIYEARNLLPAVLKDTTIVAGFTGMVAVSLAAGIGTLPFTSIYFGKISIVSFIANLIIVPLSNVILVLGMLTVGISFVSSWLASIYAGVTSLLTWLLLKSVELFGNLPVAYIDSRMSFWSIAGFYGAIAVVANIGREQLRKYLIIACLIVLDAWLYGFHIFSSTAERLRVTFLDVGQGDAIVLQLPGDRTILVDGGPRSPNLDAGARVVEPFLKYNGIREISAIVLTHPHSDHLGGIPSLLHHLNVKEVIDAGSSGESSLAREYENIIDSLNIPRTRVQAGVAIKESENVRIYVLHPSGAFVPMDHQRQGNLNNQSVVLKLCYGETTLLLAGDAEREAEEEMAARYGSFVHSGVLKAGHHGSITSSSPPFCKLVKPAIVVISVGIKNKFHHPSPVVLQRYVASGSTLARTDESGAIILESDGKHWSRILWRSP